MDQGMSQRAEVWIKVWIREQRYGSRYESESSGTDQEESLSLGTHHSV